MAYNRLTKRPKTRTISPTSGYKIYDHELNQLMLSINNSSNHLGFSFFFGGTFISLLTSFCTSKFSINLNYIYIIGISISFTLFIVFLALWICRKENIQNISESIRKRKVK